MSTPRVTVFIPAWNRERLVAEAIQSTLAQRYGDFECLVIDDGSSDATRETVRSFSDPRVRLVENGANLGIPRTRNRGIDLARGEYVALLDSDDRSLPERLALQVAFLDAHPEVAAVGAWARAMRADGSLKRRIHRCPATHAGLRFALHFRCAPRQSTLMVRRSVLQEFRYDERCAVSQDLELFGRIAAERPIRALPRCLVLFRHHPGRITEQPHPQREAIRRRIFEARLRASGVSLRPDDLERHLRLSGRSYRLGERVDPDYARWAGNWLTDLAQRCAQGPEAEAETEVWSAARHLWARVLRRLPLGSVERRLIGEFQQLSGPQRAGLAWRRLRETLAPRRSVRWPATPATDQGSSEEV